MEKVAEDR